MTGRRRPARPLSRRIAEQAVLGAGLLLSWGATAQTYTVLSATPATAYGNVSAAVTGDTVFFQNNTTLSVVSGSGARISGTVARTTVTIRCTGACSTNQGRIKVGNFSTSGRAKPYSEFIAIAGANTTLSGTTSGTSALDFTMTGWTNTSGNQSRTFTVDTKMPIAGDNEGGTTGALTNTWYVYAAKDPTVPTVGLNVAGTVTVRRSLRTTLDSNLNFGSVFRPASGNGTVIINATTGVRTTGGGTPPAVAPLPLSGRTQVTITGEPNTRFALSYSPTGNFTMTSGANSLTVTVSKTNNAGNITLNGTGTQIIGVGGTITVTSTTPRGQYSGNLIISVLYN